MATSDRKKRALSAVKKNNLVAVLVSVVISVFAPQWAGLGGTVATVAQEEANARIEAHCEKHGGCE